nr:MAG TPA: outer membrane protein [Caudoviricetes sp.]
MCGETDEQRAHIRSTIGAAVDALVDGLYPQAGEERDE